MGSCAQGLDVDTPDTYGGTPLWERASLGRVEQIPLLLSPGAGIQRPRQVAGSPLHRAAGATVTGTTREEVRRTGQSVEFHRADLAPDFATELDAGLAVLYRLTGTEPAGAAASPGASPLRSSRWAG